MFLPAVELRHLSKFYREGDGERVVLRDAGATVGLGEIGVLVGRSGSGKSTVLNLISGIDRPPRATVRVNGTDLTALDERERTRFRREHIGFIFQFFNLVPLLTVEENLLLPLELLGERTRAGGRMRWRLLARVGLADRARAYPRPALRRRAAARGGGARARRTTRRWCWPTSPPATSTPRPAEVVLDLLDGLARELGKTVVMVTHSREVVGVADRVFRIEQGQLVERRVAGTRDEPAALAGEPAASPAPPVADRPQRAGHRAGRGGGRVHRPGQRERAPRLRAGHRGGDGPGHAPDRGRARGLPEAVYRSPAPATWACGGPRRWWASTWRRRTTRRRTFAAPGRGPLRRGPRSGRYLGRGGAARRASPTSLDRPGTALLVRAAPRARARPRGGRALAVRVAAHDAR